MAWLLRKKEIEAVLALDGPGRYGYCIKKIADEGRLWSLAGGTGWVLMGDGDGELVPIWPHEQFASLCANGSFAHCEPKPIEIAVWLERWIPGTARDGRRIAIFPTPEGNGVVVSPERLEADLRNELSNYE